MFYSVIDVYCNRFEEDGLTLEEIQAVCRQYQTLLQGFMPETMDIVHRRATYYRYVRSLTI